MFRVYVMKMSEFSGTRIILLLCFLFIAHILGSQCECETESLSHPGCGVIPTSSTIINGSPASYPWMVFLYNYGDTDTSFCGGILISDLQILSAAHCFEGKTIDEVREAAQNHFISIFPLTQPLGDCSCWQ